MNTHPNHGGLEERDPGTYVGRHRLPDTTAAADRHNWLSSLLHKK